MKINYEGETLEFDLDQITVREAMFLKMKLGLTLLGLDQGLATGDPEALLAIYWLIRKHSNGGRPVDIDELDFKVVALANAVQEAVEAEAKAQADAEGDGPKEDAAAG